MQGRGVAGVIEAGFIAAFLQAGLLFLLQIRRTGINLFGPRFKDMLIYGAPLVGSGLVMFMLNGVDRWILADQVGNAQLAQYAIAAKFALAANLLIQPYVMWWMPRRFQVVKQPGGNQRAADYAFMGVTLVILVGFMVSSGTDLLMQLLLPGAYSQAATYVLGLVLIVVIKETGELLNLGCFYGSHTHAQLIVNVIAALLAFAGLTMLVPILGINGAILALLMAQVTRLVLYMVISQRILRLPYRYMKMLQYVLVSSLVVLVGQQLSVPWIKAAYIIPGSLVMLLSASWLGLIPTMRIPGIVIRMIPVRN
jgi:O-antigen/teichoic acid export membrane protein